MEENVVLEYFAFEKNQRNTGFSLLIRDQLTGNEFTAEFDPSIKNACPPWCAKVPADRAKRMIENYPNSYRIMPTDEANAIVEQILEQTKNMPVPESITTQESSLPTQPEPMFTAVIIEQICSELTTPNQRDKVMERFNLYQASETPENEIALQKEVDRQLANAAKAKKSQDEAKAQSLAGNTPEPTIGKGGLSPAPDDSVSTLADANIEE